MNDRELKVVAIAVLAILVCIPVLSAQERKTEQGEYYEIPELTIDRIERFIDVGGRKLHCFICGKGNPAVILVSGFGAVQDYWNPVIPELSEHTTIITYDRPGYGKSELGDIACDGGRTAEELHILLDRLKIPGPYIMVGHSYGGKIVRLFASMYPEEMAGMILEDSSHEGLRNAQSKVLKGKDLEILENMIRSRSQQTGEPRTELECLEITFKQLGEIKAMPQVPLTVLTAGIRPLPRMFSNEGAIKVRDLGFEYQKKYLELIPGGKQIIVKDAGHNLHFDRPDVLIKAVIEIVNEVKME